MYKKQKKCLINVITILCTITLLASFSEGVININKKNDTQKDPITHIDYNVDNTENNASDNTDHIDINQSNNETEISDENEYITKEDKPEAEQDTYDIIGYTVSSINVRSEPNTDCLIYEVFPMYTQIQFGYIDGNSEWVKIQYGEVQAYLYKEYVNEGLPYEAKPAINDKRKSYMDWRKITRKTSMQYVLQNEYAYTASNGVRAVEGRYCIALGSFYTQTIGQFVDVVLENGVVLPCILGDVKQDIHTTNDHSIGLDGGVVEFIVDTRELSELARKTGDISYVSNEWKSNVVEVRVYYKNLFDN